MELNFFVPLIIYMSWTSDQILKKASVFKGAFIIILNIIIILWIQVDARNTQLNDEIIFSPVSLYLFLLLLGSNIPEMIIEKIKQYYKVAKDKILFYKKK